ncbi:MAG: hypothetical protein LBC27_06560, partial [Spirochaetaceae bacterium]|nr:hypothetical protein [Spirochaetaceae bacterium]
GPPRHMGLKLTQLITLTKGPRRGGGGGERKGSAASFVKALETGLFTLGGGLKGLFTKGFSERTRN